MNAPMVRNGACHKNVQFPVPKILKVVSQILTAREGSQSCGLGQLPIRYTFMAWEAHLRLTPTTNRWTTAPLRLERIRVRLQGFN